MVGVRGEGVVTVDSCNLDSSSNRLILLEIEQRRKSGSALAYGPRSGPLGLGASCGLGPADTDVSKVRREALLGARRVIG